MDGARVVIHAPLSVGIEPFTLDDRPLASTEAIIRTRLTLISPGTELARFQGQFAFEDDHLPPYPLTTVGYANIGTVIAAGAAVGVAPGERVYSLANHASLARIDVQHSLCIPVPAGLSDEDAVFTRLATVSMTTLRTTIARGGDRVAVVGLGLVGNLAAQVFQTCGMPVNAFDLSPARREHAAQTGVHSVHAADAMPSFAQQHRLVIEATGSAVALADAARLAARGGEIVMIGAPWGGEENSVPSNRLMRLIFSRFLHLRSGSEWEIPRQPTPLALGSIHANSVTALDWLAAGRLAVQPLITHRFRPDAIADAYHGLRERKDEFLGVVLQWGDE